MNQALNIANLAVNPGERKQGWLPVSGIGALTIQMPVTIVHGTEEGPKLAVTAGIHGSEYAGIEASIRLGKELEPQEIRGSVIIVHVVNVPAFQSRTPYICPLDGLNLNKIRDKIPSERAEGSISHRMLYTLLHEVVYKADAYIDMHGGDLYEALTEPFIIYPVTPNEKTNATTVAMADSYGVDYVWGMEGPGTVAGGATSKRAPIPSIMVEAGQEGRIEERFVRIHVQGVLNVMGLLGMLKNENLKKEVNKPIAIRRGGKMECDAGGIFYSYVRPSDRVPKGQLLGEVKDVWGEVKQQIFAPADCMMLMYVSNPMVGPGDVVFGYAEF